jgi:hypothetical protein
VANLRPSAPNFYLANSKSCSVSIWTASLTERGVSSPDLHPLGFVTMMCRLSALQETSQPGETGIS